MFEGVRNKKIEEEKKSTSPLKTEKGVFKKSIEFKKPETTWESLMNRFKNTLKFFKDSSVVDGLKAKQREEIETNEKMSTIEGMNFSRCQMDRILESHKAGKRIEFETFSPYLSDYNTATGEIWEDNLTKSDLIGLSLGRVLRENFPDARLVSLYDEYNSEMPDSTNIFGNPTVDGPQLSFSDEVKINFKRNIEKVMKKSGLIRKNDLEGKDFLFISESSKADDAEKLVLMLEEKGKIKRDGQAIYFINPEAENSEYSEITLRTKNGRWLCEALDASSYLKTENVEITHLVILPNHFKKQQDKVWEMLRVLGISSKNYHNIFFDEDMPPERAAEIVKNEIFKAETIN